MVNIIQISSQSILSFSEFASIQSLTSTHVSFDSSALFECQIDSYRTLPNTKTILLSFTEQNHGSRGHLIQLDDLATTKNTNNDQADYTTKCDGVEMYLHNKFASLAANSEFGHILQKVNEKFDGQ